MNGKTGDCERKSRLGVLATTSAVGAWGFGNAFIQVIPLSGPVIAVQRLIMGTGIAGIVLIVSRRRIRWLHVRLSLAGGVALALNIGFFFSAVKYTSPVTATVIETLQPAVLLVVAGSVFGEKICLATVAASLVAFVGTVIVVLGAPSSARGSSFGDFLAVMALVSYCVYFVASKKARKEIRTIEYQLALQAIATVTLLPLVVFGVVSLSANVHDWLLVSVLAVIPGTGHYLLNWSHRHISLSIASLLTLLTPVITMLTAYLLLGEQVTVAQIGGIAIVVSALSFLVKRIPNLPGALPEVDPE